jgi:chemotaxis protein methyltransferase CheR
MSGATDTLRGFVRDRAGISMGADKDYLIVSRLEPQLRVWNVPDLDTLAQRVRQQPNGALAGHVVAALTINETLWFRDGRPFELLTKVVLPDLLARPGADRNLAIWSAACSTGQEVYSIAMTLRDEEARLRGWTTSVLGSDICEPAVGRARNGVYSQFEVQRGLPIQKLVKYFDQVGTEWRVKPALREQVSFRALNLMDLPAILGPFQVVFCRNVLIYFDVDVKARVLSAIARRMRPGGYLLLGAAETTLGITTAFVPVAGHSGLYRLPG